MQILIKRDPETGKSVMETTVYSLSQIEQFCKKIIVTNVPEIAWKTTGQKTLHFIKLSS